MNGSTLTELLLKQVQAAPEEAAYHFLSDPHTSPLTLSFGELHTRAVGIAQVLREKIQPGDRALLLYAPGLEYISAFMGCLYAGVIPVPAYPPNPDRLDTSFQRLESLIEDAKPSLILTTWEIEAFLHMISIRHSFRQFTSRIKKKASQKNKRLAFFDIKRINTGKIKASASDTFSIHSATNEEIAYLQYTSGSTGNPKGVMITHRNVFENMQALKATFHYSDTTRIIGWLPLQHDLGMILAMMPALFYRCKTWLFSPFLFIRDPLLWLQWISRYQIHCSGGPLFSYAYTQKKTPEAARETLDLSSWQYAGLGGEPVRPGVLRAFADYFAPCGFSRSAFVSGYGQAECTLSISASRSGELLRSKNGFASVGHIVPGHTACIVNPETGEECAAGLTGEIWFQGPNVAKGYWANEKATRETFGAQLAGKSGQWLRTGDLGFFDHGELFVVGRIKEIIIFNGKKYSPHDIEDCIEMAHAAIRKNCIAMFSWNEEGVEFEKTAAALEIGEVSTKTWQTIANAVQAAVLKEFGIPLDVVILMKKGTLPKTTSGKVQRQPVRKAFLEKELPFVFSHSFSAGETHERACHQPTSMVEERLLAFISEAIGEPVEDPDRNLFSYGVHSLAAADIACKISRQFDIILDAQIVFEYPTVRQLAEYIQKNITAGRRQPGCKTARADGFSLASSFEEGLWIIHNRTDGDSFSYHLPVAIQLEGRLNVSALQQTLNALVSSHEALRTLFRYKDGTLYKKITPFQSVILQRPVIGKEQIKDFMEAFSKEPFDLETGPLYRFSLITLSPERHIFLANLHHIICDGPSFSMLAKDFSRLYAHFCTQTTEALLLQDPVSVDEASDRNMQDYDLDFWKKKLKDVEPLNLPLDFPRPAHLSSHLKQASCVLTPTVVNGIRALARQYGCTMFVALHAIYSILLARHCNQSVIPIGVPVSGRLSGAEKGVGFFVNLTVMISDTRQNDLFPDFLKKTAATCLEALQHQQVPFWKIVQACGTAGDTSRHPLVQTGLVWQAAADIPRLALPALKTEVIQRPSNLAEMDLVLTIQEEAESLTCLFEYNAYLFESSSIESMADHFVCLADSLVRKPLQPIHDIPIFSEKECQILLDAAVRPRPADRAGTFLHTLFEKQAEKTPDFLAIQEGSLTVSYGELDRHANHLAHYLDRQWVFPGERIIIIRMQRGIAFVTAMLAVLKAGCAFVSLGPEYSAERLGQLQSQTGAPGVLDDSLYQQIMALPAPDTLCRMDPNPVACIIYTSGSTGEPKGVVLAHQNFTRLTGKDCLIPASPGNMRVAQMCHTGFDPSIQEIFFTLHNGGSLHVVDNDILLSGHMAQWARENRITHLFTVTSLIRHYLLNEPELFSIVEYVLAGGETLYFNEITPFANQQAGRHAIFYHVYGPTETGVMSHAYRIPDTIRQEGPVPLGKIITGTSCYLLDEQGHLCPKGTTGEIFIGGDGVALGYFKNPAATEKKFIANPFVSDRDRRQGYNTRLYRTGDRGRLLPDGNMAFEGRKDSEIKLRGFRINLDEIEHVLLLHPEVARCVAMTTGDGEGKKILAFVGNYSSLKFNENVFREHMKQFLPGYMVPAHFIRVDHFPHLPSGKVDKPQLLRQYQSTVAFRPETCPPVTHNEQILHAIWQAIFRDTPVIGLDDDFFALGGNSLLAAVMTTSIQKKTGVSLSIKALFTHSTLRDMSRLLDETMPSHPVLPASLPETVIRHKKYSFRQIVKHLIIPSLRIGFFPLVHVTVKGRNHIPASGPLIVACNHSSYMDTPLTLARLGYPFSHISCDPGLIAAKGQKKRFGWFFYLMGQPLYVARGYENEDRDSLQTALAILQSGGMVIIAPEGTINDRGNLIRAQQTIAWLATESGAPVLPMALWGHEQPFMQWKRLRRVRATLNIGSLLYFKDNNPQGFQKIADTIMQAIAGMMPEQYHGHYQGKSIPFEEDSLHC